MIVMCFRRNVGNDDVDGNDDDDDDGNAGDVDGNVLGDVHPTP